ncbi:MAG: hypothetical protein GY765_05800 [bacterium]|nr:hypothetical protein [bacterium]
MVLIKVLAKWMTVILCLSIASMWPALHADTHSGPVDETQKQLEKNKGKKTQATKAPMVGYKDIVSVSKVPDERTALQKALAAFPGSTGSTDVNWRVHPKKAPMVGLKEVVEIRIIKGGKPVRRVGPKKRNTPRTREKRAVQKNKTKSNGGEK